MHPDHSGRNAVPQSKTPERPKGSDAVMDRLLFLVARDQPDLWDQLNKEFAHGDVSVVVDRRRGDRRREEHGDGDDRRNADRRARADVDLEVKARGFSVIRLESEDPMRPQGDPRATRTVQAYLQERFRHYTTVASWDAARNGQGFVIFNSMGHPAHRVLFERDFLEYYGTAIADRIPTMLDEWRLTDHLEASGPRLVVVSTYGARVAED